VVTLTFICTASKRYSGPPAGEPLHQWTNNKSSPASGNPRSSPARFSRSSRATRANPMQVIPQMALCDLAHWCAGSLLGSEEWTSSRENITSLFAPRSRRNGVSAGLISHPMLWPGWTNSKPVAGTWGAIVPLSASTLRRKRRRNALAAGLTEWPQQRALIPPVPVGCVSMATSISWSCKPGHESAATMWDTIIEQSPQKPPRPSGQSIHRWPNNAGSLRLQNDR
jgi:hypothetical protein